MSTDVSSTYGRTRVGSDKPPTSEIHPNNNSKSDDSDGHKVMEGTNIFRRGGDDTSCASPSPSPSPPIITVANDTGCNSGGVGSTVDPAAGRRETRAATAHGGETLRPPRAALPREAVHPFFYNSNASNTPLQMVKLIFFGLLLMLPLRIVFALLLLALMGGLTFAVRVIPPYRRQWIKPLLRTLRRWLKLTLGYWRVNRVHVENYGLQPDGSYAEAPVLVANHCAMQDSLVLLGEHDIYPTISPLVSTINTSGCVDSVLGRTVLCAQRELVYWSSSETGVKRQSCVSSHAPSELNDTSKRRCISFTSSSSSSSLRVLKGVQQECLCDGGNAHDRPMLIFPEMCYTNGRTLVQFNTHPAFSYAVPIQPVILRYPYTYFDQSWCGITSPWWMLLLKTMCQVYNRVEITYLPVYNPSVEEKQDSLHYAVNVHHLMARHMQVPETAHNCNDIRLLLLAHTLKLPIDAINVETGHPHFAMIPYKRMEHMLCRFAMVLNMQREKLQQKGYDSKRRYKCYFPTGFMSSCALAGFLTPLKHYPILLERLLYHLTRRAAVRGMYVTFRDFLSAMTTEPIVWDHDTCIPDGGEAVYMDEAEVEADITTAVLRRTFAMMLLSGNALLDQQRADKDKGIDAHAAAPSLHVTSTTPTTADRTTFHTDTKARLAYTFIYGSPIRYLHYTSYNGVLLTPVAAAVAIAADDALHKRQLRRDVFNILVDILFVPHHATMWGGAATKSTAQLKEERVLFTYIQSGATSPVAVEQGEERIVVEHDVDSHITLYGFLRFGRKHRALAEYFHACCEHFLIGDDLA